MKKILFAVMATMLFLQMSAQTKTYRGAWFEVKYPKNFVAKGSIPSATSGKGFDSAFFTSPDGQVEFYIYSPQWNGKPTDIALKSNEKKGKEQVVKNKNQVITYWTITAKNGSYTRSYQETRDELQNTSWVVGIKYKNQKAYNRYKKQYIAFKSSLEQFADGL